jgi:ATP-dependent Clp protease protease subunit
MTTKAELEHLLTLGCFPKERIIYIGSSEMGEDEEQGLDYSLTQNIISSLLYLDRQKESNIILIINCIGGKDEFAYALYDAISMCRSHVCGIGIGHLYSAASIFIQSCDTRYMTPNSKMLIHFGTAWINRETNKQFQSDVKFYEWSINRMYEIYSSKSKLSKQKLKTLCDQDTYFSAEEALKVGLIDKIITKWSEAF